MLRIERLAKQFPGGDTAETVFAVDDVSLEVGEGQFFTLLGPSGCGKSTTLRCIAGLEDPDSGTIALKGQNIFSTTPGERTNIPVNKRGFGMVFQSYAVWPHMDVFENVAFPLKQMKRSRRPSKTEIRRKVMETLETMELATYASRSATKLSGGQQQRLALARALVTEPPLLLLDEPLSNLDANLRELLRIELKRLQRELGITCIYVTHDQAEALTLSNAIAVMNRGRVLQIDRPRDIYENPTERFVAEFVGTSNFIDGVLVAVEGDTATVDTDIGRLRVSRAQGIAPGTRGVVSIRPEVIEVDADPAGTPQENELSGEVLNRGFMGDAVEHLVRIGEHELRVRSKPSISIPAGRVVYAHMDPGSLRFLPDGE